jgi:uncharacterized membrane protein
MFYAVITIVFIAIVAITGGDLAAAVPIAIGCFLIATGYAWWRFRQRQRLEAEQEQS